MPVDKEIQELLRQGGIEDPAHEARLLAQAFDGEDLRQAAKRRAAHEPLQYILGEWDFWRETYEVNEHCLIPRPDTEHLVEQALKLLPKGARFLDLCTGSGCVAISVLASRKDLTATAVDLFPKTLELASRNAVRNGVKERLELRLADVLRDPEEFGEVDAILSNPPYIQTNVIPTLSDEVKREPYAALCGGADGLDFYRAILQKWRCVLKKTGFFLFEIGYDQAKALRELGAQHDLDVTVFRDYGGNDRVVLLCPRD